MNMTLEDRLRDAYQAAARTVRAETIHPAVRYHATPASPSHRRFSIFAPIAAAAAVVAVVAAAVTVPGHLAGGTSHRTPAAVTTPAATGTAPFLLEVTDGSGGSQLAVQQAGTHHVAALIPPPHDADWGAISAVARTTFIAAATTSGSHGITSAIYRLTLSASGQLSELTQVRSGISGRIGALTGSQGGRQIAYVALPENGDQAAIGFISSTGTRQATAPLATGPGDTGLLADCLSMTADGGELGFITFRVADTVGPVRAAGTTWLLPVSYVSGSSLARSHKVTTGPSDTAPFSAVLSPNGQTTYVLSLSASLPDSAPASRTQMVTLTAYSTADGALLRTVHIWTGNSDSSLGEPGMSMSGSQLLVWGIGGTTAYQVNLVSGATSPVWVYSLQDKYESVAASSIAW